jgi:hypothetical protein
MKTRASNKFVSRPTYLMNVLEFSDSIGITDECQTGSSRDDVRHVFPRFVSQITQN